MKVLKKIKKLCLILFCILTPTILNAQHIVKGTVVSNTGETLIGVSIKLGSDASKGTVTDMDGKFSISVSNENEILSFTYLGFESEQQKVTLKKEMKVIMIEKIQYLDETVVIGYQNVRRRDVTGSISQPNLDDMLKTPMASFDQALAGRVAGVQVSSSEGTPGGGMDIVIRGKSTLTGDTGPLYVIDGFIEENSEVGRSVNPNDIESIDILKDASAAAIYGRRGANGVIIITTKKGQAGKLQVNYDFDAGMHWLPNEIKLMDAYDFVKLQEEVTSKVDMESTYYKTHEGKAYTLDDYKNIPQYNWQNEIFENAWQQSHNISLTGGTSEARYKGTFRYYDQDGIVINSNYNKIQGTLGTFINTGKWRIDLNAFYSNGTSSGTAPSENQSSGMNNLFYSVWGYRPVTEPGVPLNSLMDNIRDEAVNATNDYRFNPIMSLENEYRKNMSTIVKFNGYAEYKILSNLNLRVSGNYVSNKRRNENFNNSKTRYGYPGSNSGINGQLYTQESANWLNENTLTYRKEFNKTHKINGVAGITFDETLIKTNSIRASLIESGYETLGMNSLGYAPSGSYAATAYMTKQKNISFLGRVNYDYGTRYNFTVSMRADGTSVFQKRWGYFPSVAGAWNFTEESFLKPVKSTISSGKLRIGWGMQGNSNVPVNSIYSIMEQKKWMSSYSSNDQYGRGVYPAGSSELVGVVPVGFGNKDLKWETTSQINAGIDISLLKDRIKFSADTYYKNTKDLLDNTNLPLTTGHGTSWANVGEISNRGLEFTLSTINIKTKDFTWSSNFNIAFNKNKLEKLNMGQAAKLEIARFDQNFHSIPNYIAKVGKPMGMMYGYIYEGPHGLEDFDGVSGNYTLKATVPAYAGVANTQPGYSKYKDLNGDGVIDANDRTIIGRGDPIHTGGFINNLKYKDFDLSIFFQWSYGNDIFNANKLMFETGFNRKKNLNQFASYANRWSYDNQSSNIPVVNNAASNMVISSRMIEDGSFLRLKNLTFGYTVPLKAVSKMGVKSIRLYASTNNLVTFTKYSGYDPEVSVRNSALTPGLDFSAYPRSASFNFGVNLKF